MLGEQLFYAWMEAQTEPTRLPDEWVALSDVDKRFWDYLAESITMRVKQQYGKP